MTTGNFQFFINFLDVKVLEFRFYCLYYMNYVKNIIVASVIPILSYTYYQNRKLIEKMKNAQNNAPHKKVLKQDSSSKTILSVSKYISNNWDRDNIDVYENEKKWLTILEMTDIIAKPISFDDIERIVTTEYVGEKINKYNIPIDWEEQRDHIISVLEKNNCRHNDIKPDELIVYNGEIKIIDFGWAIESNKKNPDNWPEGLGGEFKCNKKNHLFNDKCSFDKSIYFIMNQKESMD